jgi:hypothetical protein
MSVFKEALTIDSGSSKERLELAKEMLSRGAGVVIYENTVALSLAPTYLLCEVVDPMPSARRCENEFEVLVENARRMLESSRLKEFLPDLPCRWLVVEDHGTGTVELWHAP